MCCGILIVSNGQYTFLGGNKHSTVYHEMNGGGRTVPPQTVLLALEEMRVVLAVSGLTTHENCTNDVGLHSFKDVFGLENGLHT